MADSAIINHFFGKGGAPTAVDQFDFSLKSRSARLREMSSILFKHKFLRGFTPVEFREMLEELGPSFVKIGQTLSTRSEILPQAYCDELALLQTKVAPLSFDQILYALQDIFGDKLYSTFSEIDSKPLGSASLAQVHKAFLKSGEEVAIKVQRPGVRETMAQDIDIMRQLARGVVRFAKGELLFDAQDVVEEIWNTFLEETDFEREAENLELFRKLNKDVMYIDCPHVYRNLCSEQCLVMEYVEGIPIYQHERLRQAGYDLNEIGEKILDNYATQILDHGFFHADPHPGNIIIREGKIVYIDLGLMGRLTPTERSGFNAIVKAVGLQNPVKLKDALLAFAVAKDEENIDHPRMIADLDLLLGSYASGDVADLDIGAMLADVLALTRACKVTLPPSITNVSRGIVTIEGTVADFIPNDSIMGIINAHILRSSDPVERTKEYLEESAIDLQRASEGAVQSAVYSGEALRMLTRGQLKVNMEMLGSDAPLGTVSKILNRLTMGIIIAGLFIGSSLFAQVKGAVTVFGIPFVSFFGFLGAFILSVWVVFDIWRNG